MQLRGKITVNFWKVRKDRGKNGRAEIFPRSMAVRTSFLNKLRTRNEFVCGMTSNPLELSLASQLPRFSLAQFS